MALLPITRDDRHLIEQVKQVIATYYRRDRHRIGAALQTASGMIFTAVHGEANERTFGSPSKLAPCGQQLTGSVRPVSSISSAGY